MKKKLLIIEDDDLIRDLYKRQLELADFEIDAYSNGKDGIAAAQKHPYSMILLDVMLPEMNGIEILQKLKQDPATKAMPVLFLSNLGQDAVINEGIALGAIGYLVKVSLTPNQLVEEIKKRLAAEESKKKA